MGSVRCGTWSRPWPVRRARPRCSTRSAGWRSAASSIWCRRRPPPRGTACTAPSCCRASRRVRMTMLHVSVLLACSDNALTILARHRAELARRFLLDEANPAAQLVMLDKLATYQAAVEAGVPTPRFWLASARRQVVDLRDELVFPLIV